MSHFYLYLMGLITNEVGRASVWAGVGTFSLVREVLVLICPLSAEGVTSSF